MSNDKVDRLRPDDGVRAFAAPDSHYMSGQCGMSLRDWFAGQALSGIIRDQIVGTSIEYDTEELASGVSEAAYQIADAMRNEREKNND